MLINIISYQPEHASFFYELNIEWLQTFFYVEPYDEEVLSNPKKYIINKGGHIFFAQFENQIIGTVALMPAATNAVVELTKMAVSPSYRGLNIGQQLMQYCIRYSMENNINSIILYSSRKLENAIYIYKKYGFIEIPVEENCPYKRCNIKMQLALKKS
jgi:N-acetylglutamate synthase-like GNAT family acetyltransferase